MRKQLLSIILAIAIVFSLCVPALAVEPRANTVSPSLTFSGTTANCSVTISAVNKDISATLWLWHGDDLVASWSDSGETFVGISGSADVEKGETYMLTVTGSMGSTVINVSPIIRTCP